VYNKFIAEEVVRIPPRKFGEDLQSAIMYELENSIVGMIHEDTGIVLAVTKIRNFGEGKVVMGDGAAYYDTVFEMITYKPEMYEIVDCRVMEITDFGAFVNFGPMDGLIHISQITEDYMNYNRKSSILVGKEDKGKNVKINDILRARIIAVSLKKKLSDSKVGLTMRQPYLGKFEWIEEAKRKDNKERVKEDKGQGRDGKKSKKEKKR